MPAIGQGAAASGRLINIPLPLRALRIAPSSWATPLTLAPGEHPISSAKCCLFARFDDKDQRGIGGALDCPSFELERWRDSAPSGG